MPCYHLKKAYILKNLNPKTGKKIVVFKPCLGIKESIKVPCGQCWGCRLEQSRLWALRCMHELKQHEHAQYVTLTYSDENIPPHNSLHKPHLQEFYKRLRQKIVRDKLPYKIRHYSCGEYGEKTERPHYHAIIYGLDLPDKTYYKHHNGFNLYKSAWLEKIWKNGHVTIGNVSFESCAYVARYIMKKVNGKKFLQTYFTFDKDTGLVLTERQQEFTVMSRKPGIGREFYDQYRSDMYQYGTDGRCIIRGGINSKVPRYYDNIFEEENPEVMKYIKNLRRKEAVRRADDNTPARLKIKEQVNNARVNMLKRSSI